MAGRKVLVCFALLVLGLITAERAGAGEVACGDSPAPFPEGSGNFISPYHVSTEAHLAAIGTGYQDCYFEQTQNIALTATSWTPIGGGDAAFSGSYDGRGFEISGLIIAPTSDGIGVVNTADPHGLFGEVLDATITDVHLVNVSIVGGNFVGGLAGTASDSIISDVTVSGAVSGHEHVGGIVGQMRAGEGAGSTLATSASSAMVTGTVNVGGAVGSVVSSAVTYVAATGAVSGESNVGGLVGTLEDATLSDSYSHGAVSASVDYAGGVVGFVKDLAAQPSEGETLGDVASSDLGVANGADVARTYARGVVTGNPAGGLVGALASGRSIVDSYWNRDANSSLQGVGAAEDVITDPPGSTLVVLQDIDTFDPQWAITNGWAPFVPPDDVWGICDGDDTPYLLWEETESPCSGGWTVTGFFAPVDMDVINRAVAGRVVPLKWRVLNASGDPYGDPHSFVKVSSSSWVCSNAANTVGDDVENYVANSGLRYLGDGYWQFNWATPKSYAGQCPTVTLTLSDGSTISADFHFRR